MYVFRPLLVKHVLSDSFKTQNSPANRKKDELQVCLIEATLYPKKFILERFLHCAAESFEKLKRKFLAYISVDVVMKTSQSIIIWP
jgi:hypothetical protein